MSVKNMTTIETRRNRGELIDEYRIMNGIGAIDWKILFSIARHDGTKGYTMKLEKNVMRCSVWIFASIFSHTKSNRLLE